MVNMRALLAGGPPGLPDADRVLEIENTNEKVKVSYGAGYEHFSHNGEFCQFGDDRLPIFQWCGGTKIAE